MHEMIDEIARELTQLDMLAEKMRWLLKPTFNPKEPILVESRRFLWWCGGGGDSSNNYGNSAGHVIKTLGPYGYFQYESGVHRVQCVLVYSPLSDIEKIPLHSIVP